MKYSERVVHRSKSKQKEDFQKVKNNCKKFQNFHRWEIKTYLQYWQIYYSYNG